MSLFICIVIIISAETRRRNSTVTSQVTSGLTGFLSSATGAVSMTISSATGAVNKITGTVAYIGESAFNIVQ